MKTRILLKIENINLYFYRTFKYLQDVHVGIIMSIKMWKTCVSMCNNFVVTALFSIL